MAANVVVQIGFNDAVIELSSVDNRVDDALEESIDDLLTFIDNAQAKAYTQDANPEKPALSRYVRTFDLQNSTELVHVDPFSGEWIADIEYAEDVLGPEAQQAAIHRGRWKSKEQVEQETRDAAPGIINNQVSKRF